MYNINCHYAEIRYEEEEKKHHIIAQQNKEKIKI
jgi:hypothetical protein